MLTAQTKSGTIFSLGKEYKKETLLIIRNNEEFFCPACGERVSLKLGNQRIYHFAHRGGTVCRDFYEGETVYHMKGKLQLYQWLERQGIPVALEYYDAKINQRPDIVFHFDGIKYALEYQCSPISEEIFFKRTAAYYEQNYIPLWIMGSKHLKAKRSNVFSLSNFDYFFFRETKDNHLILPSYCPEEKQFKILSSIYPYSIKNALANITHHSIQKTGIEEILSPEIINHFSLAKWSMEMEKFTLNLLLHPSPNLNRFLREIYRHNLNIYLLPPEIGLPVSHSLFIQTPSIIWQTYLYLDVLQDKMPKDLIDLKEVEKHYNKRLIKKEIINRNIPQLTSEGSFSAVKDYFQQLERLGILVRKSETVFQLETSIFIPKSNREKEERRNEFCQKNKFLLAKL
ncbi:competence protein CoiA family protein [Neobacillus sp. 179-C4.2 HS]|uniref:Competence protein CoiA family protein n=1 Tax=Neobacillus driksii TaxID=3035913 RepID=A0ABV4YWD6_9BACI|nr:competence protein CoiA family protein [Neobacillus sp. 179.-C4.2 HS]MDP5192198.1 competence protein CoiA family protein [Neobacillus sp. 179.-C4.2 HS]